MAGFMVFATRSSIVARATALAGLFALLVGQSLSAQTITRGPYLQLGTPSSVVVRWRTSVATNSRVRFGVNAASLTGTVDDATLTTEHQIVLSGLGAATQYYYSVGSSTAILASGLDYKFTTAPTFGTVQPTRIWVLGDSGTAGSVATAVRNGYTSFTGATSTDVWLMLGDNAYNNGTDAEYQAAVFNMYPTFLRQTVLWSTIGNHDTAGSTDPSSSIPHFQIFNLPTDNSAGGVASGTEKYYSFDHGSIHFICLDSMTSSRAPGSAMLTWLEADLANTTRQWIIAFWHHPPYTKGSHDSDTETQLIEMRTNVLPILEAGGVDLVLTGHSHSYERTFFINGHYGLSTSFTPAMKINGGSGRSDGTGAYSKQTGLPANQGAVYIVAGNGGKVTSWTGGSTAEFNPTPHAAMFYSALHVGSMVLDVNGNQLEAKMIRDSGLVDDYFTLVKNDPIAPPAAPTGLAATAGNAQVGLVWNASANAASYAIKRASVSGGPYTTISTTLGTSYTDTAVSNGSTYYYVVSGSNSAGEGANSAQVTATPVAPVALPAAPSGLIATTASRSQINLAWVDNANNETGYRVERSTSANSGFVQIAVLAANATGYASIGLKSNRTYYHRIRASNGSGNSAYSNTASAKTLK